MTPSDDQVQIAGAPQKLEWVTPKISLMEAGDTEGSGKPFVGKEATGGGFLSTGPS